MTSSEHWYGVWAMRDGYAGHWHRLHDGSHEDLETTLTEATRVCAALNTFAQERTDSLGWSYEVRVYPSKTAAPEQVGDDCMHAVRVYVPTDVRPEMLDGPEAQALRNELDETRAQLAEEQTAHATLRALWDARCGTIASVQARLEAAERVVEATQRVLVQPEHWEERVRQALAIVTGYLTDPALPAASPARAGDDS